MGSLFTIYVHSNSFITAPYAWEIIPVHHMLSSSIQHLVTGLTINSIGYLQMQNVPYCNKYCILLPLCMLLCRILVLQYAQLSTSNEKQCETTVKRIIWATMKLIYIEKGLNLLRQYAFTCKSYCNHKDFHCIKHFVSHCYIQCTNKKQCRHYSGQKSCKPCVAYTSGPNCLTLSTLLSHRSYT